VVEIFATDTQCPLQAITSGTHDKAFLLVENVLSVIWRVVYKRFYAVLPCGAHARLARVMFQAALRVEDVANAITPVRRRGKRNGVWDDHENVMSAKSLQQLRTTRREKPEKSANEKRNRTFGTMDS
jgi:hypothetical protein